MITKRQEDPIDEHRPTVLFSEHQAPLRLLEPREGPGGRVVFMLRSRHRPATQHTPLVGCTACELVQRN